MPQALAYERVNIDSLKFDPRNARKHDDRNIKAIMDSLSKFGQQKAIVVGDGGVVIAGNGTLEAAKRLGWDTIDVRRSGLKADEATAYAIADNRSAELAEWDDPVLGDILGELKESGWELDDLGFNDEDLKDILKQESVPGLTDEDEVPEVDQNEFGVKRGDIWKLGNHRIMCGDSTLKENVEKLMNGKKPDMVFTDPPYAQGVNPSGFLKNRPSFKKLSESDLNDFNPEDFLNIVSILDVDNFYVHCNKELIVNYIEYAKLNGRLWDLLAICKANPIPIKGNKFLSDIEWVIFSRKKGAYFDDTGPYDWYRKAQLVKTKASEFGHPTEKWVNLIEQYLNISSKISGLVCDLFLGSGSTLIACEKTGRKCYGMELDEHYCSVIIKRWQDFTGKVAERIVEGA